MKSVNKSAESVRKEKALKIRALPYNAWGSSESLERDVVVKVHRWFIVHRWCGLRLLIILRRGATVATLRLTVLRLTVLRLTVLWLTVLWLLLRAILTAIATLRLAALIRLTATQHLHDTREAIDQHFGGIAFLTALILPLAGLQFAFNVDLRALLQVFASDLGELAHEHHAVPLDSLFLLAGLLIAPAFTGGEGDVGDGAAAGHIANFGVLPQITDQDDFVDAARSHVRFPSVIWCDLTLN